MLLRHLVRDIAAASVLAAASISAAHAGERPSPGSPPAMPDTRPVWKPGMPPMGAQVPAAAQGLDPRARGEWLAECRHRYASADRGLGGALIGGTVGGLLGNRIAGKHHRTGTLAGAAVGAVAGAVIDRAEDAGHARDYCESYLDDYYARAAQPQGYPQGYGYGYGQTYGYAVPMMMVPVRAPASLAGKCSRTMMA